MKNNKPLLSKKKKAYLAVAQRVNATLTSEFRISDSSALAMYDKAISPYGYHSHQNMLITEGLAKYFFNKRVAEKNITDQDVKYVSISKERLQCPSLDGCYRVTLKRECVICVSLYQK